MFEYIAGVGFFGFNPLENGLSTTIVRVHSKIQGLNDAVVDIQKFIPHMIDVIDDVGGQNRYRTSVHVAAAPWLEPGFDVTWNGISLMSGNNYATSLEEIYISSEKVRNICHSCNSPESFSELMQTLVSYVKYKVIPNTRLDEYRSLTKSIDDTILMKLTDLAYRLYIERNPALSEVSHDTDGVTFGVFKLVDISDCLL